MGNNTTCFVCGAQANVQHSMDPVKIFYSCPVCGRYEYYVQFAELTDFDLNHLGAYLIYNGFHEKMGEYRYFTTMSKERCDEYKKEFEQGNIAHGHPIKLVKENIENWYPKTFSEKVDYILLYFNSHIKHMGESIILKKEETFSCLFVDRYDYESGKPKKRTGEAMKAQANYMIDYLAEKYYIISPRTWTGDEYNRPFALSPEGYSRIDILQKNIAGGKNVLVAMKFGGDTKLLREAIWQGVTDAGYVAIFIDEVEHNDFITPKLLKYIRDSKFFLYIPQP